MSARSYPPAPDEQASDTERNIIIGILIALSWLLVCAGVIAIRAIS